MAYPYKGKFQVSQPFLNYNTFYESNYHLGIDLVGLDDKKIYSVCTGVVYEISNHTAFGNSVIVKCDGLYFRYSHLAQINVKKGEYVREGIYQIGVEGKTGSVYGTGDVRHLDLRISKYPYHTNNIDDYINPAEYLGFLNKKNDIINPSQKEDDIVIFKNAIICKEGIDEFSSGILADSLNCPVILSKYIEGLSKKQIENIATNIFQIGIPDKLCDKAQVIAVGDRWDTAIKTVEVARNLT